MAWNEPGGGKKDPWGGDNQGPPDLDEAFKKLQDKLNNMFGGKRGGRAGGSGSDGGSFNPRLLLVVLGVVAVLYFLMGFYQVDQQERAVVLRFGKYLETVQPGLHWNWPLIDNVQKVNVTKMRSVGHRSQMLTEDENIIDIAISVQYVVDDPQSFLLRVRAPEASLEQAMESALRHVVGSTTMDQAITEGREQIAVETQARLQQYVDRYETGIRVSKVNIESAQAPAQVQEAFDDVTRAKEDRERLKNQAEAYANSIIPEARGQAQRIIEEANGYREQSISAAQGEAARFTQLLTEYQKAPEVTRERLYIEALQDVMSKASKVIVDVEGGNNLLYLPLDKLMERRSDSATTSDGAPAGETLEQQIDRLQRTAPARMREGR
ncbi:MAG: FtsH protease activity modulator HflK [Spongiibacteraceae bacterium]|jgi:membrane protease subunit HflK|nr:FtsH protease activity modulator HflK [Spongiibacteraceae bacterium]